MDLCLHSLQYVFMESCLLDHKDIFAFTLSPQADDEIREVCFKTRRPALPVATLPACQKVDEGVWMLQVPREDPCEFCLCLDGELFCWWQDCPPSNSGPCAADRSISSCGMTISYGVDLTVFCCRNVRLILHKLSSDFVRHSSVSTPGC